MDCTCPNHTFTTHLHPITYLCLKVLALQVDGDQILFQYIHLWTKKVTDLLLLILHSVWHSLLLCQALHLLDHCLHAIVDGEVGSTWGSMLDTTGRAGQTTSGLLQQASDAGGTEGVATGKGPGTVFLCAEADEANFALCWVVLVVVWTQKYFAQGNTSRSSIPNCVAWLCGTLTRVWILIIR